MPSIPTSDSLRWPPIAIAASLLSLGQSAVGTVSDRSSAPVNWTRVLRSTVGAVKSWASISSQGARVDVREVPLLLVTRHHGDDRIALNPLPGSATRAASRGSKAAARGRGSRRSSSRRGRCGRDRRPAARPPLCDRPTLTALSDSSKPPPTPNSDLPHPYRPRQTVRPLGRMSYGFGGITWES
jgi:hypothetical protein